MTRQFTRDFILEVAKGNIANHKMVQLRGHTPLIAISQTVDIWEASDTIQDINELAAATTLYISSENAGDTNNIIMTGLDGNFNEQTGIATLNGQNQVEVKSLLGASITWIGEFNITNFGSTDLLGNVWAAESDTLTAGVPDTDAKVQDLMRLTFGTSFKSYYIVPDEYSLFIIDSFQSATMDNSAEIRVRFKPTGLSWIDSLPLHMTGGAFSQKIESIRPIAEKTQIKVTLVTSSQNVEVSGFGGFMLIKNTELNQAQ